MKQSMRRALALLIALLLAIPLPALADAEIGQVIEPPVEEASLELGQTTPEVPGDTTENSGDTAQAPGDLPEGLEIITEDPGAELPDAPDGTNAADPAPSDGQGEASDDTADDGQGEVSDGAAGNGQGEVSDGAAGDIASEPVDAGLALEEGVEEAGDFVRSVVLDDVVVTVRAAAGVFPSDAELSVKVVSAEEQAEAESAVEELREEEDVKVARSYTFDIKVINPETGEE